MKIGNALTKLCPMTPRGDNNDNNRCVATGCMAWRWYNDQSGYCGLAGKPDNSSGSGQVRVADPAAEEVALVRFFVEGFCVLCEKSESPASVILTAFFKEHPHSMSAKRFGQIIASYAEAVKRGGTMFYKGIRLA